jgi:hypothetical protein
MKKLYDILYILLQCTIQLLVLSIMFIASNFYIVSSIYTERSIGVTYITYHVFIDVLAVLLTLLVFYFFMKLSSSLLNKKLYIISLVELSIYFLLILCNGILDKVSKGNVYLKPVSIVIEFIIYLVFLFFVVRFLYHKNKNV